MDKSAAYGFWSKDPAEVLKDLNTSLFGLTAGECARRKERPPRTHSAFVKDLFLFLSQFRSPLSLLLLIALSLSSVLGDYKQAIIIFSILFISFVLSFAQERKATRAADKLRAFLRSKAKVKREGEIREISIDDVVPGDIILLEAGDIVPADSLILSLQDLYVNESALTGESFPSEKKVCSLAVDTPLSERRNSVFRGTNVVSGTAVVVAVKTGKATAFGEIESDLGSIAEETAFEKGIRNFGQLLMKVGLLLAGLIVVINIWAGKNPFDSILFALALSVGLAPEMLPAIVTITLSAGARKLSQKKVIVKKLSSIQNLGAIDVLCSDKTGTLTEGEVKVHSFLSVDEEYDEMIERYAYLNAFFESGYANPMDNAIREQSKRDVSGYQKFDEVPYDFIRKRLSIVVAHGAEHIMITKGALKKVTEVCNRVRLKKGDILPIADYLPDVDRIYEHYSAQGFRVIGVACKDVTGDPVIAKDDETDLVFLGFIFLYDPVKNGITEVIERLRRKNISLKVITGDNRLIAENMAARIGIPPHRMLSGKELDALSDEAVLEKIDGIDVFSETEPSQKERIVRILQKKGHVVGYLGDGINDAQALKVADVGISVNNAVDVAKESADMILMEKELKVLSAGITEGRKTYLNTLKYIFITISANFGNMFSMAGISLFLPFLPLLPSQILLINFLTDIPALSIASDRVDSELLRQPRRWNVNLIRNFMLVFGLESSVFDFVSFGVLLWVFHASELVFHTGWFIESVFTEVLILLVIRTHRTFTKSKVGRLLMTTSVLVITAVIVIPYIPFFSSLGFVPLSPKLLATICLISVAYALLGEATKKILFSRIKY